MSQLVKFGMISCQHKIDYLINRFMHKGTFQIELIFVFTRSYDGLFLASIGDDGKLSLWSNKTAIKSKAWSPKQIPNPYTLTPNP